MSSKSIELISGGFSAWCCLLISYSVEILTALLGLVVILMPLDQDLPWILLFALALLRCGLCFISSRWLYHRWFRLWARLDSSVIGIITSSVAYGFIVFEGQTPTIWRIATVAIYPIFNVAVAGNLRCMLKYYPWQNWEIIGYKLIRFLNILTVVVFQLLGKNVHNSPPIVIAYFGAISSLQLTLLALVVSRADEVRKAHKEQEAKYSKLEDEELDRAENFSLYIN